MLNVAISSKIMSEKKKNQTVGRKWFNGKSEKTVVAKCEDVWALGGTDAEASFLAGVSKFSLSRYLKQHPDIEE